MSFDISNLHSYFTNNIFDISFSISKLVPGLNVDTNSFLVSTLCTLFNTHTNSNLSPIPIGGATYARAFKNSVSFGPNLPNQKDMCHQADEFIDIDHLMFCVSIYIDAIYELSKEDNI